MPLRGSGGDELAWAGGEPRLLAIVWLLAPGMAPVSSSRVSVRGATPGLGAPLPMAAPISAKLLEL